MPKTPATAPRRSAVQAAARCACGAVRLEIDAPAFWAWHDHSQSGRRAHGGAYATYVGSWRSRLRILAGEEHLTRWENPDDGTARSFCARCGTPMLCERPAGAKMVDIPRGVFEDRTGREPRYHIGLSDKVDWIYEGAPLAPLKGYPGVMRERPRRQKSLDPFL